MISFENTQNAFEYKSDRDLKKAYILFKTLSSNLMVRVGKNMTNLALSIHFPIKWIVKPTIYSHFVGGELLEDCLAVVEKLGKYNVKAILDYSVEGETTEENIQKTLDETIKSIKYAKNNSNIPFAVFKPSAFASENILEIASSDKKLSDNEKVEANKFKLKIELLCKTAFENDIPILVDAEDFAFQKYIDEVVLEMMKKFNKQKAIVFNTLQMYRHDRLDFLKTSLEIAKKENFIFGAKFVRGAYMEKERERADNLGYTSPIQLNKENTDNDFNEALRISVENLDKVHIFCGTHNEKSCIHLSELMEKYGISKNDTRIYFAQLYGMSDHISFNLAKEGYNVAKYIPYGPMKFVMPYLIRRAEENTSVSGQTGRELKLLTTEMNRRKDKK